MNNLCERRRETTAQANFSILLVASLAAFRSLVAWPLLCQSGAASPSSSSGSVSPSAASSFSSSPGCATSAPSPSIASGTSAGAPCSSTSSSPSTASNLPIGHCWTDCHHDLRQPMYTKRRKMPFAPPQEFRNTRPLAWNCHQRLFFSVSPLGECVKACMTFSHTRLYHETSP